MDQTTLTALLDHAGVEYELRELGSPTRTAAEASHALGVPTRSVVKSLVCLADQIPVLALIPGDRSLALDRLREATGAEDVVLARGAAVKEATGYPIGAVAPLGHPSPLPTYADLSLRRMQDVYFGGGTHRHMLRLTMPDLERLTRLFWVDLTIRDDTGPRPRRDGYDHGGIR